MSTVSTNTITDAAGGAGTVINGVTPNTSNVIGKNKIINGNFDIWQRGTIDSAGTSAYSTADRWFSRLIVSSGGVRTVSREDFPLGQSDVPNANYFLRYSLISPTDIGYIGQKIEGCRTLAGRTVTVSFYAKADSSKTLEINLTQYMGTGGSPSDPIVNGLTSFNVTSTWQKYVFTISLSNLSGSTVGTDGNDSLQLYITTPSAESIILDVAQVQIEEGPVATEFELRHTGTELALCQRYYEVVVGGALSVPRVAGVQTYWVGNYKASKRAIPTVALPAVSTASDSSGHTPSNNNSTEFGSWSATLGGSLTNNVNSFTFTADAEL